MKLPDSVQNMLLERERIGRHGHRVTLPAERVPRFVVGT